MTQNSTNVSLEDQQQFLKAINEQDFINEKGALDVCLFAFFLADALYADGFSPSKCQNTLQFLFDLPTSEEREEGFMYEMQIKVLDETNQRIYPYGKTICFSHQLLINRLHHIVSEVGTKLLKIDQPESVQLYSWWVKRENVFTYCVFDKLFKDFSDFLERFIPDYKAQTVLLHMGSRTSKSQSELTEYAKSVERLFKKDQRIVEAQRKIEHAVSEGFFLEAIALIESSISDRLSLLVHITQREAKSKSFSRLIEMTKGVIPGELYKDLDTWRSSRNKCIHNMVRSSPFDELPTWEELESYSKATADQGYVALIKLNEWFGDYVARELNPFRFHISLQQRRDD